MIVMSKMFDLVVTIILYVVVVEVVLVIVIVIVIIIVIVLVIAFDQLWKNARRMRYRRKEISMR